MTTLADVTSQFLGLMNRTDLNNSPTLASTFINQAIMRLQRELRVPFMEKTIKYTIPSTYDPTVGLPIPSDLLELIDILVDGDQDGIPEYPIQRVQYKDAARLSEAIDVPQCFARLGGNWLLGPQPAVGSSIWIVYYAEFAPLVNPTDSNTLINVAWDAVVYAALSAACDFYNDDRSGAFEARYTQISQMLQNQADADELTADAAIRPALLFSNGWDQTDGMQW